jgi:hypothetical protein
MCQIPLLSVYIKRPLSVDNYWWGKPPFFFCLFMVKITVSTGFS